MSIGRIIQTRTRIPHLGFLRISTRVPALEGVGGRSLREEMEPGKLNHRGVPHGRALVAEGQNV